MTARRWGVLLATIVAVGACSAPSQDTPAADMREETVAGVTVDVPRGWRLQETPDVDGIVAMARFSPRTGTVDQLQIVVGCGDADADELIIATVQQPRGGLVITDAEDAPEAEVDGLETARTTLLTFGAGRDDDANTLYTAGLYGTGSGGLVIVEFTGPVATFDRARADAVLDSVRVDADELRASCESG